MSLISASVQGHSRAQQAQERAHLEAKQESAGAVKGPAPSLWCRCCLVLERGRPLQQLASALFCAEACGFCSLLLLKLD